VSDTNPLPAQELLALADAMMGAASHLICQSDVAEPIEEFANESAVQDTIEAYRAARAASPVTLEEALVREMHEADEAISDAGSPRPDELTKRWNTVAAQLKRHARRLAGEGGGK